MAEETRRGNTRPVRTGDRTLGTALDRVREALTDMRYGEVTVVVQDGVVVQVERTEKLRLPG